MGHAFYVDERVLIPRQDTEILCERAIFRAREKACARVLDLCCGSGAIGIALKLAYPQAQVWLSDLSQDALDVARVNALGLGAEVAFRQSDLLAAMTDLTFDVIVCNPPYLTLEDMGQLQREVRFEPGMALFGGDDGLDFYRRIAQTAPGHIAPGGALLVEVGAGQAEDVARLLGGACSVYCDLPGIKRVVERRY